MAEPKPLLLIVDDNAAFLSSLRRALSSDYRIMTACDSTDAERNLSPAPAAVLLDIRLNEADPVSNQGLSLLDRLIQRLPGVPVIMMTAYADVDIAVQCMKRGAADFVQKLQGGVSEIRTRVARALEQSRLFRSVTELKEELRLVEPREIVGESAAIQEVRRMAVAVAQHGNVTVLIRGETGTGKELVARAIHASGPRATGPFVAVNLSALPAQTIESELFGYTVGAFTDAKKNHAGYLERANGGVMFLDEIGEADLSIQLKILRFLEEREFQPLGSTVPIGVDVQVVAATNADLEKRVSDGRFREDLYFRLNVHQVIVPALRQRAGDIPLIVDHFLLHFRQRGRKVWSISSSALKSLIDASWPGNVRQLRNTLESALFWAEVRGHDQIEQSDLPSDLLFSTKVTLGSSARVGTREFNLEKLLARVEVSCIEEALGIAGGKKEDAWKLLGYNDRFALYRRLRRLLSRHSELQSEFPLCREALTSKTSR